MTTNGFQTGRAIGILNLLLGNIDHKGGYQAGGTTLNFMGEENGRYPVGKLHPGAVKPAGVRISREQAKYEDTTEFKAKGYPAQRPWFPLTKNVYQEVVAGIMDGYPYPVKILWLHMGTPAYSIPGMKDRLIRALKNTSTIPLFIATDIVIGDTSMYADYILPDVSYLEQWNVLSSAPTILGLVAGVRQPMTHVLPQTKSVETIFIDLAQKMNLPGFGDKGFGENRALSNEEDWYLKLVANLVAQYAKIPGATEEEQIKYILDRGGIFDSSDVYDGALMSNKVAGLCHLYAEEVAMTIDAMTGKNFDGLPNYYPVRDALDQVVNDEEYPYTAITYKPPFHTQSRTISAQWLTEIQPENFVQMNDKDGINLGLQEGDLVRISGPSNKEGVMGKVHLHQGIRPGVIAVSTGYGHWNYGAIPTTIDNETIPSDPNRCKGVNLNATLRVDDSIGNVCLQDKIGGSCSFSDSRVKVEKV